eukprot:9699056-Karenia_brevis.AAC.1
MKQPTGSVSDAPQAYEVLKPRSIDRDLDYVLRCAERSDNGFVSVFEATKSITTRSPNLQKRFADRMVVVTDKIRSAVGAFISFRYYRMGDR